MNRSAVNVSEMPLLCEALFIRLLPKTHSCRHTHTTCTALMPPIMTLFLEWLLYCWRSAFKYFFLLGVCCIYTTEHMVSPQQMEDCFFFSSLHVLTHIPSSSPVPGPPSGLEGEAVGSNGILLSWTMPLDANNIDGYVIRWDLVLYLVFKYMCWGLCTCVVCSLFMREVLYTVFVSNRKHAVAILWSQKSRNKIHIYLVLLYPKWHSYKDTEV